MNELALFAGAGGGILGGKLLGWRTVCAVEWDGYARDILVARQNDGSLDPFPIWDDVQTFDGRPWRGSVEVVSGGFPCQDISAAGKGVGIEGERSGMWRHMARIVGEVRPRFVFVENSPMLVGRGLAVVVGDLAEMGYDARWGVLGAHHAGAPHKRDRIWIVAYDTSSRWREGRTRGFDSGSEGKREQSLQTVGDPECEHAGGDHGGESVRVGLDMERNRLVYAGRSEEKQQFNASSKDVADPSRKGLQGGKQPQTLRNEWDGKEAYGPTGKRGKISGPDEPCCFCGFSFDIESVGIYGCPNCYGEGLDEDMPNPDCIRRRSGAGGKDRSETFDESWWTTEPDVGRVAHGVAARVDRLRCIGNGQVPQVAALAWEILSEG